jgi:hypothetical protein
MSIHYPNNTSKDEKSIETLALVLARICILANTVCKSTINIQVECCSFSNVIWHVTALDKNNDTFYISMNTRIHSIQVLS